MLDDRQQFKVAFLRKCAEHGLTLEETHALVRHELQAEKQAAGFDPLNPLDWASTAYSWGKPVVQGAMSAGAYAIPPMLLAPIGIGLAGGALAGDVVNHLKAPNPDEIKDQDTIDAYRQEAERMRLRNELAKRRERAASRPSFRSLV